MTPAAFLRLTYTTPKQAISDAFGRATLLRSNRPALAPVSLVFERGETTF